jgi:hypothetical protein
MKMTTTVAENSRTCHSAAVACSWSFADNGRGGNFLSSLA